MTYEKIRAALSFISPKERDTWVKMAMAVKSELYEDGYDLWDQWSQGAESYDCKAAKTVWKSIAPVGKISIGTLFHLASSLGWRDNGEHRGPLSKEELEEKNRQRAIREKAAEAEEKRKQQGYEEAANRCQVLINACTLEKHYYLNAKGFPDMQALVADGVLVVPMRDYQTNALRGAQTIEWIPHDRRWEKKMIPGMRAKGAVLRLGSAHARETYLCEGYATGLSIELAIRRLKLNASVLICFSDSNMAHVATMVKGKAFCCADNDVSLAGEKAAQKTGFPYAMSDVVGEDFNDVHHRAGVMAVCKLVMDLRRK